MTLHAPDPRPIVAQRAVLRIESAEIVDSSYADNDGYKQKQIKAELLPVAGTDRREAFLNWFAFRDNGQVPHHSKKAGQLVAAVFGPGEALGESLDEMAANMAGRYFAAKIGLSEDGKHSRIVHDTIGPATGPDAPEALEEAPSETPELEEPGDELPPF